MHAVYFVSNTAEERILSIQSGSCQEGTRAADSGLDRVQSTETEPSQLEVETSSGQAEHASRFGEVATTTVQRALDHLPLHLLDGCCQRRAGRQP